MEETVFATVGEDGSVRLFDTRELRNSNIIYETTNPKVGLTHVKWNLREKNMMAVVAENDTKVLLFDKRKPNYIVETLNHDSKVNAIAWSPAQANMICSVVEGVNNCGNALIWDLYDNNNGESPIDQQQNLDQ